MTELELKAIVDNEAAMAVLPEASRNALITEYEAMKKKREEQDERQRKFLQELDEQERRENEERRRKEDDKRRDILGLKIGKWTQNIPRNRRFVIACCDRIEEVGYKKYEKIKSYCPIDLLRGFTAPYFGYYHYIGMKHEAKKVLTSVLDAPNEESFVAAVRRDFDFFHYDKKEAKIAICDYTVDQDGDCIIVNGRGAYKNLAEHQADLKSEFCKE